MPRASIIWLAHAVKVVRPAVPRLHLDRVRFAKGWHLGITLGICMSGFENFAFRCKRYVTFKQTRDGFQRALGFIKQHSVQTFIPS